MFEKYGVHTCTLQGLLNWFVTVGNLRACQFMKDWSIDAVILNAYFPKREFPAIPAFPGILNVRLNFDFLYAVILPPLHERDLIVDAAAQHGHLEILKFLVEWWRDDPDRALAKRALLRAAESGHLDVCQYVMSLGLTVKDIRAANELPHHGRGSRDIHRNYDAALHGATKNGHAHIVRFFRDCGLPLRAVRSFDNHALRDAAARGYADIVELFRDWNGPGCGLNVHDLRTCGNAALRCAAKGGHIGILRMFKDWGPGLTMWDVRKSDIMRTAVIDGNINVLHFLREWNSELGNGGSKDSTLDKTRFTVHDIRKYDFLSLCIIHDHPDVLKFFKAWRDPECGQTELGKTRLTLRDVTDIPQTWSLLRRATENENIPLLQVFRDWVDEYPDGTRQRLSLATVHAVYREWRGWEDMTPSWVPDPNVCKFFEEWMRSQWEQK